MTRIVSLQTGLPRLMDPHGQPWTTATFKDAVLGRVALTAEGLAGDGHADREHHGGRDKAVLVYSDDIPSDGVVSCFPRASPPEPSVRILRFRV